MFYEKSPEIREGRVGNEEMREREVIERIENLRFVKLEERMD